MSNIPIHNRFFESITAKQIDEKLFFLKRTLPKKPTRKNYQISRDMLGINRKVSKTNLQEVLQEAADIMRTHLNINRFIKIITLSNIQGGKFERINDLNCIYINGEFTNQTFDQKLAILAHEMSHYYLIYEHKIMLPNNDENELLTEINAIFVGFGLILLRGYRTFEKKKRRTIHSSKVGYITLSTVRKSLVKTAYLRKQNPIWILKNVGIANIFYFAIKLFDLVKIYYKSIHRKS